MGVEERVRGLVHHAIAELARAGELPHEVVDGEFTVERPKRAHEVLLDLFNLHCNAITHGFAPGVAGQITIAARRAGAQVQLRYRDDGKGMSAAVRAQIYEPFFTTRRGQGGSGLGMHVVYNLVTQLLKGSIRVESAEGAGTPRRCAMPS